MLYKVAAKLVSRVGSLLSGTICPAGWDALVLAATRILL